MIEKGTGMYLIPAGTQPSECSSCRQRIYFVEHTPKPKRKGDVPRSKPLPISLKHVLAIEPTRTTWGRGISHHADCPDAGRWRQRSAAQRDALARLEFVRS